MGQWVSRLEIAGLMIVSDQCNMIVLIYKYWAPGLVLIGIMLVVDLRSSRSCKDWIYSA